VIIEKLGYQPTFLQRIQRNPDGSRVAGPRLVMIVQEDQRPRSIGRLSEIAQMSEEDIAHIVQTKMDRDGLVYAAGYRGQQ
jgi:hypothetical protein